MTLRRYGLARLDAILTRYLAITLPRSRLAALTASPRGKTLVRRALRRQAAQFFRLALRHARRDVSRVVRNYGL